MKSIFPPPTEADIYGGLCLSRDITPAMLLDAYYHGIFPWPFEEGSILWSSPRERGILPIAEFHLPKSLARTLRKRPFGIRIDTCFGDVIDACASFHRQHDGDTWITSKLRQAYRAFHRMGYAHSFEAFNGDGRLVGGLYGVLLGKVFCGESMFHYETDASKVAFCTMVDTLQKYGVQLIDTQMVTPVTQAFGAREVPNTEYFRMLASLRDLKPSPDLKEFL